MGRSHGEETETERLDRRLDQLLQELRGAMPGVQVLFAAYHRLMAGLHDKPRLVEISGRLALAGLVALAVAMNGAILLVTDVLFDGALVVVTVAATSALFIGLWFVLGLVRRSSEERSAS